MGRGVVKSVTAIVDDHPLVQLSAQSVWDGFPFADDTVRILPIGEMELLSRKRPPATPLMYAAEMMPPRSAKKQLHQQLRE